LQRAGGESRKGAPILQKEFAKWLEGDLIDK